MQHLPRERTQRRKVLDLDVQETSLRREASARRGKLAANSRAPSPFYKAIDRGQQCSAAGVWLAAPSSQGPSRRRAAPLAVPDRGAIPACWPPAVPFARNVSAATSAAWRSDRTGQAARPKPPRSPHALAGDKIHQ